jgi:hypothetical protein
MSVERAHRSWSTAGAAAMLIGAGLLTRVACAPAAPPVLHAPGNPAVDTRTRDRAVESSNDTASARAVDASTNQARPSGGEPHVAATPDAPFTASGVPSPSPGTIDAETQRPAPNGALPAIQRQELSLLASIERDLKREAPPEVHALLSEYRRGADRSTLIAHVHRDIRKDLPLRVTVLRWIDQVRPDPNQPSPRRPQAPGQGGGAGWVRPLERR